MTYSVSGHRLPCEVRVGGGGSAKEGGQLREEGEEEEHEQGGNLQPHGPRLRLLTSSCSSTLPLLSRSSSTCRHVHPSRSEELEAFSPEGASSSSKSSSSKLRSVEHARKNFLSRHLVTPEASSTSAEASSSREPTAAASSSSTRVWVAAGLIVHGPLVAVAQHLKSFGYHCGSEHCQWFTARAGRSDGLTLEGLLGSWGTALVGMETCGSIAG